MQGTHPTQLPAGVTLAKLTTLPDDRGDLTEVFREEWHGTPLPVQWLISRSNPNVLRGVHVHARSYDYVSVIAGEMVIGLHDLRSQHAPNRSAILRLSAAPLQMLVIPPGVAHGFYSPQSSTYLLGATQYFDSSDHLRCRWNAPELGLDWPCDNPSLSDKDRDAGEYANLRVRLAAAASI